MLQVTIGNQTGRFYDREPAAEWIDCRSQHGEPITVEGKAAGTFGYRDMTAVGPYDDAEYVKLRNQGCPPTLAGLVAARRYRRATG